MGLAALVMVLAGGGDGAVAGFLVAGLEVGEDGAASGGGVKGDGVVGGLVHAFDNVDFTVLGPRDGQSIAGTMLGC